MKSNFLITLVCFLFTLNGIAGDIKIGNYRGVLIIDTAAILELPFNFEVQKKGKKITITIHNAEEKIIVDEIKQKGDSIFFKMPVFDTEFRVKKVGDDWQGLWINHYRKDHNKIPFIAIYNNTQRFEFAPGKSNPIFEGKWETTFSNNTKDSSKAIGVFHHLEQTDYVTGTFLTETGDYRYLEGMKHGDELYLSCFNGSHAFLFKAKLEGDVIYGTFHSGSHWKETWTAKRNESFKLRDADKITYVKDPKQPLEFSFENLNGKKISIKDPYYKNKAVIVQIMGSWCPNCMDESKYLAGVYSLYKNQGIEIIALAFEKTSDKEKARKQLQRFKNRMDIQYEILMTDMSGKDKASELLSPLNKISAFPTTIFLNKQHEIVKVHTGFSGPATGNDYEVFKKDTEKLIQQLIKN